MRARQIYLYLLAGILSEPIFGLDWSSISFRNVKISSLKGAQSTQFNIRVNENYVKQIFFGAFYI